MGPEHRLQEAIVTWCRNYITEPKVLLGFDRSKAQSARQHLFENRRGIVAGTPDMALLLHGRPGIFLELKSPVGTPNQNQRDLGERIGEVGHWWWIIKSVSELCEHLADMGVRLDGMARVSAQHMDAKLGASVAAKKLEKRAVADSTVIPGPRRREKLTVTQMRRFTEAQVRIGSLFRDKEPE
jgi:hypothetical protein